MLVEREIKVEPYKAAQAIKALKEGPESKSEIGFRFQTWNF